MVGVFPFFHQNYFHQYNLDLLRLLVPEYIALNCLLFVKSLMKSSLKTLILLESQKIKINIQNPFSFHF